MVAGTGTKKTAKGKTAAEKADETGIERLTKRIMERAKEESNRVISDGEKERAEALKGPVFVLGHKG